MLTPKKVKYRRWQRMRHNLSKPRVATRGTDVNFGEFGLKSQTECAVNSNQIEAARRVISRAIGKTGKVWIRIFPDRPRTKKAAEVGMGKGKGDVDGYEFRVLPGRIIFEVAGVSEEVSRDALTRACRKMPIRGIVVGKHK